MRIREDVSAVGRMVFRRMAELREQQGAVATVKYCGRFLLRLPNGIRRLRREAAYDHDMGIQTGRRVAAGSLGIAADKLAEVSTNQRGLAYVPSPFWVLEEMLGHLAIRYGDYTFADLGSGMGRVVLKAAEFPFRKVIGVEFSAELHRIAQANLESRCRYAKAGSIELICRDVSDYAFAPDNCLIYMFNPFKEGVMKTVLDKIRNLVEQGSDIYLLYLNPVFGELFDGAFFLKKIKATEHYSIYHGCKH